MDYLKAHANNISLDDFALLQSFARDWVAELDRRSLRHLECPSTGSVDVGLLCYWAGMKALLKENILNEGDD